MHIVVFLGSVILFGALGAFLGNNGLLAGMIIGPLFIISDQLDTLIALLKNQKKEKNQ
jgi:hypothetical protein